VAATTQELIIKGFQIHSGSTASGLKEKIEMIASHYGTIKGFLKAARKDFDKLVFKVDNPRFKLTNSDFAKIQAFQKSGLIDANLSVQENFVKILATRFISRQLLMIENMQLETLNVNPILSGALNLNNEEDLIRYYTYQAISRSIVTSAGFLVEDLLLYASDSIVGGKHDEHGEETKWDLVVERLGEVKAYLEIKSGPNDLDKAQIHHYHKAFDVIEKKGFRAFIGETYGKREDDTVTHGLYKTYLPNWEKRTLIGRELWEFVSGTRNYHEKLVDLLFKTSKMLLADATFSDKIEKKLKPLTSDFKKKYKTYDNFLKSLW
jgi:hypothetical protein